MPKTFGKSRTAPPIALTLNLRSLAGTLPNPHPELQAKPIPMVFTDELDALHPDFVAAVDAQRAADQEALHPDAQAETGEG